VQVAACNAYSQLDLPESPLLLIEFHGTEASVSEQASTVERIAVSNGGVQWRWSSDPSERKRLWQARHDAYYAALALRPGARGVPTDVCVPISSLAKCIAETRADIDASGLVAPIVGHVGDGNFHIIALFADDAELERALALNERLVARALQMGGTCTGEHGVGYGKLAFMGAEHDAATLRAMAAVKEALDPQNILNPGKVVPPR
jgi:D-lactate dehydrogenase (cytochrome)